MGRLEKECPRCKGERGFWDGGGTVGLWFPCRMCNTQGKIRVTSEAEFRRLERSVTNPKRVKTKQREKER